MSHGPHLVSDVMTHTVVAVGRGASFKEIVELMQQWKISALPVLEGEGRVVGVVSEADLLPKEEFRDSDPDRFTQLRRLPDLAKAGALTAGELMSTPAVTVHADATLAEAARVMAQRHVKRLPVTTVDGLLEGVVSRADLLKVFLRSDEEARRRDSPGDRLPPLRRLRATCPGPRLRRQGDAQRPPAGHLVGARGRPPSPRGRGSGRCRVRSVERRCGASGGLTRRARSRTRDAPSDQGDSEARRECFDREPALGPQSQCSFVDGDSDVRAEADGGISIP